MDHPGFLLELIAENPSKPLEIWKLNPPYPWTDPQEGRMSAEYKADSRGYGPMVHRGKTLAGVENTNLDGGNSNIFYFNPCLGEMIQFDFRMFFKWVGSTTN